MLRTDRDCVRGSEETPAHDSVTSAHAECYPRTAKKFAVLPGRGWDSCESTGRDELFVLGRTIQFRGPSCDGSLFVHRSVFHRSVFHRDLLLEVRC